MLYLSGHLRSSSVLNILHNFLNNGFFIPFLMLVAKLPLKEIERLGTSTQTDCTLFAIQSTLLFQFLGIFTALHHDVGLQKKKKGRPI